MLGSLADSGARSRRQPGHPDRRADRRPAGRQRPPLRPRQGRSAGGALPGHADLALGDRHRRRAVDRLLAASRDAGQGELGSACRSSRSPSRIALLTYQRHVIRQTGSLAIKTDNVHYESDLLLNSSVIAALVLDQYAGHRRCRRAVRAADRRMAAVRRLAVIEPRHRPADGPRMARGRRARFLAARTRTSRTGGLHDLRTRTSGKHDFVQFHVWVPSDWTVAGGSRAHGQRSRKNCRRASRRPKS